MLRIWLRRRCRRQTLSAQLARLSPAASRPRVEQLEDRRLLAAGALDPTFGTGGLVTTDILSSDPSVAHAVNVTQPDGKILVGGESGTAHNAELEFAVARYNADGSLDTSFGHGGYVLTLFPNNGASIAALAVQPDGKIVAAGSIVQGNGQGVFFAVARYYSDGHLDDGSEGGNGFGSGGMLTTGFSVAGHPPLLVFSQASAVVLQPINNTIDIVVAGTGNFLSGHNAEHAVVMARYLPNGSLDTTFGNGGKVGPGLTTTSQNFGFGLALQANNQLVVSGKSNGNLAVFRYNTDGSPDTNFGSSGVATASSFAGPSTAFGVALQADGEIVAAGAEGSAGSQEFALARFTPTGILDTSFGSNGIVTTAIGSNAAAAGVAIQANGKILAAGTSGTSPSGDFAAARYTTDGTLDTHFGGDGTVVTAFGSNDSQGNGLALRPSGFVIVGGTSRDHGDFALAAYHNNGKLDNSFGQGGQVITDLRSSADDFAGALATAPDGTYVVAGASFVDTGGMDLSVARYNPDGTPDTAFGLNGQATVALSPNFVIVEVTGTAIQRDGKILISGDLPFAGSLFVARLNKDGTLDTAFGNGGLVTVSVPAPSGNLLTFFPPPMSAGLVLQPDGKMVVAGTTTDQTTGLDDLVLLRFNANGTPDTTFGNGGEVIQSFGPDESAGAVVRLAGGKLLVVGTIQDPNTGNYDFLLARFNADGSPDTTFGSGGAVTAANMGGGNDAATSVAVTLGGKLIVAGTSLDPVKFSSDFAVARFNADGTADTSFNGTGYAVTDLRDGDDRATGVAIQEEGHIVVAGYTTETGTLDVVRYNTDGTLDTTFGTGGVVLTTLPQGPVENFGFSAFAAVVPRVAITPGDKILTATSVQGSGPTGVDFALARYVGTESELAAEDVRDTPALDPTVLGAALGEVLVDDLIDVAEALLSGSPTAHDQAQALANGIADLDLYFAHG